MLIDLIAGARPNFMKIASIIQAIEKRAEISKAFGYRLVHTGQHYDQNMSATFFSQLGIPEPDVNLGVGSGSQAGQTAGIMTAYENLLVEKPCNLCLVVGDVTSTMSCAITAQKLKTEVAHVEAGIRSNDWSMPEEINRMVTDSISNYCFTTSENANQNLISLGVPNDRIFFVGNTMIDTLLKNMDRFCKPSFWDELHLQKQDYFVLTLHRPGNVDEAENFISLLTTIEKCARGKTVVYPVHPRSAKNMSSLGSLTSNIEFIEPQPYLEFNYLVQNAKAVITDSGGITEETTVMGIPCMTLRDSTERPETISMGTNELVGTEPENLIPYFDCLFQGNWKEGKIPPKWDGKTGDRIVGHIEEILLA
ncbi:MAG TPA: UDP-N-acetylglucosamine 2-epimerase (non-hydrolyzing) [Opitutae bacterium]|nr:UDP-N-acetylglucosamine 2-epimerase (non-hydrolyzing) [Opitutae bacterium]